MELRSLLRSFATPLATVFVVGGAAAACIEDPEPFVPAETTGPGGFGNVPNYGGQGGAGGGDPENIGKQLFEALEADLAATCESSCHGGGGIANTPFLAGPDRYASITSWPGILKVDWQTSSLLTHAKTGAGHTGPNLDSPENAASLLPAVEAWLAEEAKAIVEVPTETVTLDPFAPIIGFNAVYLDELDPALAGQSLTFYAELITPTTLKLTELKLLPAATLGVHVIHPLFVVHPISLDPEPDPVDSFSNVEVYVNPGDATLVGPGVLLLTNWREDAKISIAFELIEPYEGGPDPTGGCDALDEFIANAEPVLDQNCTSCHGNVGSNAHAAVDMSGIGTDSEAACAQVKNRVSLDDPPSSQLFITTNPGGNAAHPFKFNGNQGNFNSFEAAVTVWIEAEANPPPEM